MKVITIILAGICIITTNVCAQDSVSDKDDMTIMKQQYAVLDARVRRIETLLRPMTDVVERQTRQHMFSFDFKKRQQKDEEHYKKEQLVELETLYQKANRALSAPEATTTLKKVIADYPKANRAGCASLYLAQLSEGKEQEKYLQKSIKTYSDCYYGDGVNVGAFARYLLAQYYMANGKKQKAEDIVKLLKAESPTAIDHQGNLLTR